MRRCGNSRAVFEKDAESLFHLYRLLFFLSAFSLSLSLSGSLCITAIFGRSMGAATAIFYAATYPNGTLRNFLLPFPFPSLF
jgi:pimeloyl-ACP methyl ester carboxylesterase